MTYVSIAKSIETRHSSSYSAARARKVPGKVVDYCASAATTIRSTGNPIFFPVSGGVSRPFTLAPAIWGPVGTSEFYRWEPRARLKEELNATLPLGFMSFLRSLFPGRREFLQMLSVVDAQRLYLQIPWIGRGAIKSSRASDLRGLFPHYPGLSVNCIRPTPGFRGARRPQKSTELQVCHVMCSARMRDGLGLQEIGIGRLCVAGIEHHPGLGMAASPIHRKIDPGRGNRSGEGHWDSFESSQAALNKPAPYLVPRIRTATKLRGHWPGRRTIHRARRL